MFSLAQVTEVAESKAAGTHVFKHHVCEVTMEMILQGSRVLLWNKKQFGEGLNVNALLQIAAHQAGISFVSLRILLARHRKWKYH